MFIMVRILSSDDDDDDDDNFAFTITLLIHVGKSGFLTLQLLAKAAVASAVFPRPTHQSM